jgi:hypothetical protein
MSAALTEPWGRTPERTTWAAAAGQAVLTVSRQVSGGTTTQTADGRASGPWVAQVRWPATTGRAARSATRYGFGTRLAAQRWAELQVTR